MKSSPEYWNIDEHAGQVLQALIHAEKPQEILEVGTSNGYSAIEMGKIASQYGGNITTIEFFEERVKLAKENIQQENLSETITVLQGDATQILARIPLLTTVRPRAHGRGEEGLGEVSDAQLTPSNSPLSPLRQGFAGRRRGRECRFDFIFLDANKEEYALYFQYAMQMITPHGLIIADNTISHKNKLTEFFKAVEAEPRAHALELTIGTGLMIIRVE